MDFSNTIRPRFFILKIIVIFLIDFLNENI